MFGLCFCHIRNLPPRKGQGPPPPPPPGGCFIYPKLDQVSKFASKILADWECL